LTIFARSTGDDGDKWATRPAKHAPRLSSRQENQILWNPTQTDGLWKHKCQCTHRNGKLVWMDMKGLTVDGKTEAVVLPRSHLRGWGWYLVLGLTQGAT
jgi:hypothetical protein